MGLRTRARRMRKHRTCKKRTRNHLGGKKRRGKKSRARKSRKSKKRRRSRKKKRRRMRGGSGCPLNKNLGEQFTLRPYNNLSSATPRGAYESTNNNYNVPTPYQASGGGSWVQDFGLSDLWRSSYSLGNIAGGLYQNYHGKQGYESTNPMDQEEMIKPPHYRHKIPDVKSHHNDGVIDAANKGTVK